MRPTVSRRGLFGWLTAAAVLPAVFGKRAAAAAGQWSPVEPAHPHVFKWHRNGEEIAGVSGSTYTLTEADIGGYICPRGVWD